MVLKNGETYLGDGLYASFDGFMIILRAPRDGGDHIVALEPAIYSNLVEFARQQFAKSSEITPPPTSTPT